MNLIQHAATPPHNLQRRIVNDHFVNVTLPRRKCNVPDDGRRPKHVGTFNRQTNTITLSIFIY